MSDTTSDLFGDIVRQAMELDCLMIPGHVETGPAAIEACIYSTHDRAPSSASSTDTGIRAARMERCQDPTCPQGATWDGNGWNHDHPVPNDPTGDAATRPSKSDADLRLLADLQASFVTAIDELAGKSMSRRRITDWDDAVTVAALLDEMEAVEVLERTDQKPRKWVLKAGDALHDLEQLAKRHLPRQANEDEQAWTNGLADEDVCSWHVQIHRRYRRPRIQGTNICQDCINLSTLLGQRPPQWLLEAEIDLAGKPRAWQQALGRCMDELGVARESA